MFLGNLSKKKKRQTVSISRVIALTFLALILLGAMLLNLPISSRKGRSAGIMLSLFTATSATCVTGLTLADTWSQWTSFGQTVILLMIEIGGLGFMSAASLAYFSLRRRISFQQQLVMAESIGVQNMGDVVENQRQLLIRAFLVEGVGALLLTGCFLRDYSFPQALKLGVFHSVSAFCNAGFDILGFRGPGSSLLSYQQDFPICLILGVLIILGGLGFLVWDDILRNRHPSRWSVYTRLVILTTGALVVTGTALICILEWSNPQTLGPFSVPGKILAAFFQSVTLRTAGFAAIDQGAMTPAAKGASLFFMLIGGSSGSTAGGLKTVTFLVLVLFLWNRMRGHQSVSIFHRSISNDHVLNAIMIFVLMISLAFFSAVFISGTSPVGFTDALYETVSAIGTVGLSAGGTSRVSVPGQILLMLLMYFGRVGVLTISMGFLKKKPAGEKFRYASTDLLIG